ncbi:helix-turn-helix domain-containing protein [Streptomyces sp. NPDC017964]|uniref:helix-turn-helix domain-containing protein n=1 Tax=Streptomyces sp. NPDC017964 TaxID=3365022 RepID=UPI00378E7B14
MPGLADSGDHAGRCLHGGGWRDRFAREGLAGLEDRPRPGRPPVYGPEVRLRVVAAATAHRPTPMTAGRTG